MSCIPLHCLQDLARQARVHNLQVITMRFSHPHHDLSSKRQARSARAYQEPNVNAGACVNVLPGKGLVC